MAPGEALLATCTLMPFASSMPDLIVPESFPAPLAKALVRDGEHAWRTTHAFFEAVKRDAPPHVEVYDIGANQGTWSEAVARLAAALTLPWQTRLSITLFEPNKMFKTRLVALTRSLSSLDLIRAEHVDAAAWTSDGSQTFNIGNNNEASSLLRPMAWAYGGVNRTVRTRTVDLAAVLQRPRVELPALVLCKMDVEGAEYTLLPHLLRTGALCNISHLIIEWHLNALPPEERLAALGQKLSLQRTVSSACGAGRAPHIAHAGWIGNNEGALVPGLSKEASLHSGGAGGHFRADFKSRWDRAHGRGGSHEHEGRNQEERTRRAKWRDGRARLPRVAPETPRPSLEVWVGKQSKQERSADVRHQGRWREQGSMPDLVSRRRGANAPPTLIQADREQAQGPLGPLHGLGGPLGLLLFVCGMVACCLLCCGLLIIREHLRCE